MKFNFFGFDPSYHISRYNFIRHVPKSRTPSYLAIHRTTNSQRQLGSAREVGVITT